MQHMTATLKQLLEALLTNLEAKVTLCDCHACLSAPERYPQRIGFVSVPHGLLQYARPRIFF